MTKNGFLLADVELKIVKSGICRVWQEIASDLGDLDGDNEQAIECCVDADRLTTLANNNGADKIIQALVAAHGYVKVLKYLSKNIRLV